MTSLPHTPSIYNDLSHNLAGLNDKLLALSQKLQGEQLDENRELGEEDMPANVPPPPRPSVTPATPAVNAVPTATSATSTVSANTPATTAPAAVVAAPSAAGILHVDTLNGLADALQKVFFSLMVVLASSVKLLIKELCIERKGNSSTTVHAVLTKESLRVLIPL